MNYPKPTSMDFYVANLLTSINAVQPDRFCMCSHTTGLTGGTGFCGAAIVNVDAAKAELRAMIEKMANDADVRDAVENAHKKAHAFLEAQAKK